jgi:hypothetical protein
VIFPATMLDMIVGGYVFLQTKRCRDCGDLVYTFRTPRKRKAPFVKTPRGRFVSHFAVCTAARTWHEEATCAGQGELFRSDPAFPLRLMERQGPPSRCRSTRATMHPRA